MSYNPHSRRDDEVYHQLHTSPQEFDINNFQLDNDMLQQNAMDIQDYQQRNFQNAGANYQQYQDIPESNVKEAYSEITYQAYDNQSNIQVSYDYAELDQLGRQYTENVNTGNGLSLNTQNLPQFTDNDFYHHPRKLAIFHL